MFQESFKDVSKKVSRVSEESFKGVSRNFQGCFKDVSRVFHESFNEAEVSRIFHDFQECFKGVSRKKIFSVFKRSFVAWHSSQLPEQKEGLFFAENVFDEIFFLVNIPYPLKTSPPSAREAATNAT